MSRGRLASACTLVVALLLAAACRGEEVAPDGLPAEPSAVEEPAETRPSPAGAPDSTAPTNDIATARPLIRYENREAAYVVEYPSD